MTDETCQHSAPDYYGRCTLCGMRLEAPSQWMRDEAARIGGTVVTMTKRYRIAAREAQNGGLRGHPNAPVLWDPSHREIL